MIATTTRAQRAKVKPERQRVLWCRVIGWLRRYLLAELLGTLCALLGASLAFALTDNPTASAVVGGWAENLGFYGRMLACDLHRTTTLRGGMRILRDLALEFGPAEAVDSLLRPALMCMAVAFLPDLHAGVFVGKVAADLVFYGLAIVARERQLKHQNRKGEQNKQNRDSHEEHSALTSPSPRLPCENCLFLADDRILFSACIYQPRNSRPIGSDCGRVPLSIRSCSPFAKSIASAKCLLTHRRSPAPTSSRDQPPRQR